MEFFRSVFSDGDRWGDSPAEEPAGAGQDSTMDQNRSAWSFDGIFKTLATKSESVIGSYRRDFEEFGSELRKETSVIRGVASRAVKDLPHSFDVGASVAQESLESVGQAIDDIGSTVWKSTARFITHGRKTLSSSSTENRGPEFDKNAGVASISGRSLDGKLCSRRERQLRAVQCDKSTYCREPDDPEEFRKWRVGFVLDDKREKIEDLMEGNKVIKEIYGEVVPSEVDSEAFWTRYFYKVHRLQQAEEARAELVRRAISGEEEEDLSWDFDDEEEEEPENGSVSKQDSKDNPAENVNLKEKGKKESEKVLLVDKTDDGESSCKDDSAEIVNSKDERESDKVVLVDKADNGESSCKDSDVSVISTHMSLPEEDHGWDEIEDVGSNNKEGGVGDKESETHKADWRKRLTASEDDDLSWDIEDDDDPVRR